MENARQLDERLRKIIGEIGGRAGSEMKKSLLADFEARAATVFGEQARLETARLLRLLQKAIDGM